MVSGQWLVVSEGLPCIGRRLELLSIADFAGFSQPWDAGWKSAYAPGRALHRGNPRSARVLRERASSRCTKCGHRPVDGLHSIENKSDKGANFSLTPELEGVQQDRSLTVS